MPSSVNFSIHGLKRWEKALKGREFDRVLNANLRAATALNGKIAEAHVRKTMQSSRLLKRNAPLTLAIKRSQKPLVDTATLFQSITSRPINDKTVFVGVVRSSKDYNVAVIISEGAKEKVTPAMRGMFFALWRASTGGLDPSRLTGRAAELFSRMSTGWLPLAAETQAIIIPARPFMKIAFSNTRLVHLVRRNWAAAIQKSLGDVAGKGRI